MPLSVAEYQIGQLFSVAEASLRETGGGEGVEVLKNEPFDNKPDLLNGKFTKGQYTYKVYHLASKIPTLVRYIIPKGMTEVYEEAWNAYPYCRTVITNPDYMKGNFFISIETMHFADNGQTENIHQLPPEKLKMRDVIHIDIANDPVSNKVSCLRLLLLCFLNLIIIILKSSSRIIKKVKIQEGFIRTKPEEVL